MKKNVVFLAVACAFVLGGCASRIRNTANTDCERRVHSDRERCLRNNASNEEAVAARYGPRDESKESWAAETLERIEAEAGK
jgi:hypothetical protein